MFTEGCPGQCVIDQYPQIVTRGYANIFKISYGDPGLGELNHGIYLAPGRETNLSNIYAKIILGEEGKKDVNSWQLNYKGAKKIHVDTNEHLSVKMVFSLCTGVKKLKLLIGNFVG